MLNVIMHTVVMLNVIMMSVVTFNAIKLSVDTLNFIMLNVVALLSFKETAHFKKCKQLFEYQHLLLLRDIGWSKL